MRAPLGNALSNETACSLPSGFSRISVQRKLSDTVNKVFCRSLSFLEKVRDELLRANGDGNVRELALIAEERRASNEDETIVIAFLPHCAHIVPWRCGLVARSNPALGLIDRQPRFG